MRPLSRHRPPRRRRRRALARRRRNDNENPAAAHPRRQHPAHRPPSAGARTERSWQVDVEDPVAARRRALDVKAEANLVSERIQRTIEHQQRADLEAERLRVARADLDRVDDRDSSYDDSVVLIAPSRLRGMQTHRHESHGHGGRRGSSAHRGPRPGAFKG